MMGIGDSFNETQPSPGGQGFNDTQRSGQVQSFNNMQGSGQVQSFNQNSFDSSPAAAPLPMRGAPVGSSPAPPLMQAPPAKQGFMSAPSDAGVGIGGAWGGGGGGGAGGGMGGNLVQPRMQAPSPMSPGVAEDDQVLGFSGIESVSEDEMEDVQELPQYGGARQTNMGRGGPPMKEASISELSVETM